VKAVRNKAAGYLVLVGFILAVGSAAAACAAPAAQEGEASLIVENSSADMVCSVYVSALTDENWGADRLRESLLASGDTVTFALEPGSYDILLTDCDGNSLLEQRGLKLEGSATLAFTGVDKAGSRCDPAHEEATNLYRAGSWDESLQTWQAARACYRAEGDRAGEGVTLNNIGQVYDAQGRYAEALEQFEAALAIAQEVGDRASEGVTLSNIGSHRP
jgi:tetratricopeptide (TPR) repeat protein